MHRYPIYIAMINDKEEAFYLLLEHTNLSAEWVTQALIYDMLDRSNSIHPKYIESLLPYIDHTNAHMILTPLIYNNSITDRVILDVLKNDLNVNIDHVIEALNSGRSHVIIKALLDRGINVNKFSTRFRTTMLHVAVYYGRVSIVRLLKERGASSMTCDGYGRTPFGILERHNKHTDLHTSINKLLLDH
jgi:ankyrin repeat protein